MVSHYFYATFSGKTSDEFEKITLRRRSSAQGNLTADVSFRTSLDASSSLNGLYDPSLVERALASLSVNSVPGSDNAAQLGQIAEFVRKFNGELVTFSDFVRASYSSKIRKISQLNPVEVTNVLYIFRDLYLKGKIAMVDPHARASFDAMVSSFLALLDQVPDPASVPLAVCALVESSKLRLCYVDLFSSGIGNFLPELRVLATEFDFSNLPSITPVAEKISALVSEFSRFLKEHDASHDYDAEFFRVVIYVLRYKKLQDILMAVGQKNISPRDLIALTKDSGTGMIQESLSNQSGEPKKIDDLIFVQYRNFLNVVYSAEGLAQLDTVFARLYLEAQKEVYTEKERIMIDNFMQSFLPLVCGGLLPIDAFQNAKYACLPVRHNGHVLAPYKISDNIFDNYDFSLVMLFEIPSYFHLLSAASSKLNKPFAKCSVEELTRAVVQIGEGTQLLESDATKLVSSLKEMSAYTVNGFNIFDILANDAKLLAVALNYDLQHVYVAATNPEVFDLTSRLTGAFEEKKLSSTSIRVNCHELSDFGAELAKFKSIDLANLPYSSMSDKTILRYFSSRVTDALSDDIPFKGTSAVDTNNVSSYANLLELLTARFDINGGATNFLDDIALTATPDELVSSSVEQSKLAGESSTDYYQIPEYLKIHDFWPEIEILKNDELRSPFKNFSSSEVIELMESRINEFNQGRPNSNVTSRLGPGNLARFMKLLGRLKQLFVINNGNTEILDAVLGSQSELQKLEFKLAEKRVIQEKEQAQQKQTRSEKSSEAIQNVYAPGPYVQIPEKMGLHEFVKELEIFRHDDLRSSYKNFTAEKVLGLMQKRIKEIYSDLPCTNLALRMSKDNLVAFIKLHAKLEKLLAWNGGNTAILDTLIHSQSVFDDFETKVNNKKLSKSVTSSPAKEYRQILDDMVLEEFAQELTTVKEKLGKKFEFSSPEEIFAALDQIINAEPSPEMKLVYGKLVRNLKVLFKHNNDQSFILDNVLLNADAFNKFEKGLEGSKAAENKFVMSEFLDIGKAAGKPVEYHDEDYILSLINSNSTPADIDAQFLEAEASIKEAVSNALSKEENKLLEEDPEEFAAINNLTAQKIRESYVTKKASGRAGQRLDKDSLEKFLKSTKKESDKQAERKWREQKAYEWSSTMVNGHRSLESGNFFSPMSLMSRSSNFPMFPSPESKEYMVLTTTGQEFVSEDNPLGAKHMDEDMFAILNRFDDSGLEKFSRNVKRLQKKNWKLIGGGGGHDRMLVLSRERTGRKAKYLTRLKTVLATTGFVFLTLIGLNIWLDDAQPEVVAAPMQLLAVDEVIEQESSLPVQKDAVLKEETTSSPAKSPSLWKRLLWRP